METVYKNSNNFTKFAFPLKMKYLVSICFFLIFCVSGKAQKSNARDHMSKDIGIFVGGSYYTGELNPDKHISTSKPAAGAFFRFNYNNRFAFRTGLNFGEVFADDSQSDEPVQLERNLNFKSRITEIYATSEFNFVEYRIGNEKFNFSPYLFLGLAAFKFKPMANYNDNWVELRDLSTEGQKTSQNSGQRPYRLIQIAIPFGIGIKVNITKHAGLSLEWGPRKIFSDYLDDVSGAYVDPNLLSVEKGELAGILSDRSKNNADKIENVGRLRGDPKTKDWYYYVGATLSFQLKQAPKECRSGGR